MLSKSSAVYTYIRDYRLLDSRCSAARQSLFAARACDDYYEGALISFSKKKNNCCAIGYTYRARLCDGVRIIYCQAVKLHEEYFTFTILRNKVFIVSFSCSVEIDERSR